MSKSIHTRDESYDPTSGFFAYWSTVFRLAGKDPEIFGYWILFFLFQASPIAIVSLALSRYAQGMNAGIVIASFVALLYASTTIDLLFGTLISSTIIFRTEHESPTFSRTARFIWSRRGLIFKLAVIMSAVELIELALAAFINGRTRDNKYSHVAVGIFLDSVDIAKSIFLAIFVPVFVVTRETDIWPIAKETTAIFRENGIKFEYNPGLVFFGVFWAFVVLGGGIYLVAVKQIFGDDTPMMHLSLALIFYSIIPLRSFLCLCLTMVTAFQVAIILDKRAGAAFRVG
jgi:hypothetical protein